MKSPTAGTLPQCDDASPTDQWLQDLVNDCEEQMGTGSWLPWLRSRLGFDLSPKWQDLPESDEPEVVTCPLLAPCPLLEVGQEDAQECSFLLQGKVGPDGERPRCALVTLDLQRGSSLRRVQDVVGCVAAEVRGVQKQMVLAQGGSEFHPGLSILCAVVVRSSGTSMRPQLFERALGALECHLLYAPGSCGPAFVWVETMRRRSLSGFRYGSKSSVAPELLRTVARVEKMIEAHLAKVFKEFRALGPMGTLQRKVPL
eukprot:s1347_g7.t1